MGVAPALTHGLIGYIETHPTTCNNLRYDKVNITDKWKKRKIF